MTKYILSLLLGLSFSHLSLAQLTVFPDSPIDSSMGDAAGGTVGRLDQIDSESDGKSTRDQQKQEIREEERDDEGYEKQSDREFNKNWDEESQDITPD